MFEKIDKSKEGWAVDICNKKATHYYKNGISLCKRKTQKFYMSHFDKNVHYSQILGYNCRFCYKALTKKSIK